MSYLAQYTIRSKQAYIFRTNSMREITGASALIRDAWDILFEEARKAGVYAVRAEDGNPFSLEHAFDDGIRMVELFCGGGNETVLFPDEETFRLVNAAFTRRLLEACPGMVPLCVAVKAGENYQKDYADLMKAVSREKNRMGLGDYPVMMPFSLMDRKTFQPVAAVVMQGGEQQELTAEALAKRAKAEQDDRITKENRWLDDLIKEDDDRSLLAVVHADGNNMGIKIPLILGKQTDYDSCVDKMRLFTKETAKAFTGDEIGCPKKQMDRMAEANGWRVRWIVNDGDDATFVCNARNALKLTECYLKAVSQQEPEKLTDADGKSFRFSSCAGICIFHSHYPFSMAYEMAEEACENAKKPVHSTEQSNSCKEEAWLDFHYIHSGLSGRLSEIRKREQTDMLMARPWAVVADPESGMFTLEKLFATVAFFRNAGVSRSRIKTIGNMLEADPALAKKELSLLYMRYPSLMPAIKGLWGEDNSVFLRVLYDLSEVYDLWFREDA